MFLKEQLPLCGLERAPIKCRNNITDGGSKWFMARRESSSPLACYIPWTNYHFTEEFHRGLHLSVQKLNALLLPVLEILAFHWYIFPKINHHCNFPLLMLWPDRWEGHLSETWKAIFWAFLQNSSQGSPGKLGIQLLYGSSRINGPLFINKFPSNVCLKRSEVKVAIHYLFGLSLSGRCVLGVHNKHKVYGALAMLAWLAGVSTIIYYHLQLRAVVILSVQYCNWLKIQRFRLYTLVAFL